MSVAAGCALAQDESDTTWYNITSAEAQQMSNAVQIVIKADGVASPDMDYAEYMNADYSLLQQRGWRYDREIAKPISSLSLRFFNARLMVNSIVPVDKYPISHLEFTPAVGTADEVNAKVCFYTQAHLSRVKSRYWDDKSAAGVDWSDVVHLDIAVGDDDRSLIITAISDRAADAPQHRKGQGLKDSDKELNIGREGDTFSVHAQNAELSELVRKLESISGRRMELDPSVDRLVTAELPELSFDDLVQCVCRCYGLTTAGSPQDRLFIRETVVQSDGAYGQQEAQSVRLNWIKAEDALGLLPNFLTRCVRVDKGNNQLVFSGSQEFADKIRADLALIDQPIKMVEVEARLIELSPTLDVDTALALSYGNNDLSTSLDLPSVQFGIAKSEASAAEFDARLAALTESAKARDVSSAKLSVTSGKPGSLFAGVNKYIQVRKRYDDKDSAIPINAGLSLSIKPFVTGRQIQINLTAEFSSMNVIDPLTKLPVVDTRKASGTFDVGSGESIVVGGLDELQTHVDRRRLPILGYLPVIGSLFARRIEHHEHSRLMLLLTPRIVEGSVATQKT